MNNDEPLVSIGIPLRNGETYLAETLSTITSQTYENLEIIIVDNDSVDSSIDICQAFALRDRRFRIHRNQRNLGAVRNYNLVAALATGKYFKWVAHDDPMKPTAIERCVEILVERPQVIMAHPRAILIDSSDMIIEHQDDDFQLVSSRPHVRLRNSFYASEWCFPISGVVRRDVLNKTGLLGNYPAADRVLLGEFAMLGQGSEVSEHLVYRRLNKKRATLTKNTGASLAVQLGLFPQCTTLNARTRQLVEIFKAICRANMSPRDTLLCRIEALRYHLSWEHTPNAVCNLLRTLRQTRCAADCIHSSK